MIRFAGIVLSFLSLVCAACFTLAAGTFFASHFSSINYIALTFAAAALLWALLEWKARWACRLAAGEFRTVALLLLLPALAFCAGFWGVPLVWEARYAAFRREVAAHGYSTSVRQLTNVAARKEMGIFDGEKESPLSVFYVRSKVLNRLPFGKWDAVARQAAVEGVKNYRELFDRDFLPVIKRGETVDPEDYSTFKWSKVVARYRTPVSVCKLAGSIAAVESDRGDMPKAWAHVGYQLDLGDIFSSAHSVISLAVVRVINENALAAAANILLSHPNAPLPDVLRVRIAGLLDRRDMASALQYEWGSHFDLNDEAKTDPEYLVSEFIPRAMHGAELFWNRKVGINMTMLALGPLQLRFDDAVRSERPGDAYGRLAAIRRELVAREKGLNSFFYHDWPMYSNLYSYELLLRDRAKMVLLCDALNAYRRRNGHYPASLEQLQISNLPPGILESAVTGMNLSYRLLPDGRFRLWNDLPADILSILSEPPVALES